MLKHLREAVKDWFGWEPEGGYPQLKPFVGRESLEDYSARLEAERSVTNAVLAAKLDAALAALADLRREVDAIPKRPKSIAMPAVSLD